jgi:uncharacterized membrane protein YhdT
MAQDREAFFEEDRRYPQCNREALITFIFFLINFVLIGVTGLVLGYNKPADEVQLIAGFPAWFLYGAGVGTIVECILAVVVVKLFFKDMSIQPVDENGGEDR